MSHNPSKECGDVGSPSSCVSLAALSGKVGGFGAGLVALGPCRGCGTVGVRADVWVWLFWNDPGAASASLMFQNPNV